MAGFFSTLSKVWAVLSGAGRAVCAVAEEVKQDVPSGKVHDVAEAVTNVCEDLGLAPQQPAPPAAPTADVAQLQEAVVLGAAGVK